MESIDTSGALRDKKARFVHLFYALIFCNAALKGLETAGLTIVAGIFGLVCVGMALYFMYTMFTLSTMLGNGGVKSAALLFCSLIPIVNLIIIVTLVRKYAETTGTKTNFFMFDVEATPAA